MNRLRHGVQAKAFDTVLIMSPDRLSRNGGDLIRMIEEFERRAVPIVFVEGGIEVPVPTHFGSGDQLPRSPLIARETRED